jgi:hypothetical protein
MALQRLNLRPSAAELRKFGFIALAVFGLLGGLVLWRGGILGVALGDAARPVAYGLWSVAALAGIFALLLPRANLPLYVALSVVAYPIGLVVSSVLMALVFYGLLTPVGLLFRLLGRDPLVRRFDREARTYWVRHTPPESGDRYFRQF